MKDKTFSKWIVRIVLLNAVGWIWASYLLAYLGREDIAETLSKTVCAEIVAVAFVYYLKAGIENLSKNNTWPDKTPECEDPKEPECEDNAPL